MTATEPEGNVLRGRGRREGRTWSVRAVWYRNPAMPTVAAELSAPHALFAQREAWGLALGALMSLDAKWMSRPAAIWRANQKVFQLTEARRAGLTLPRTLVTRSPEAAWSFISSLRGPAIAKPVTYGSIDGTTPEQAIYTTRLPRALRREDLEPLLLAPAIIQEEIPKRRDVRVTVVGSKVFAWASSQRNAETATDWRRPLDAHLEHVPMDLPASLCDALCDSSIDSSWTSARSIWWRRTRATSASSRSTRMDNGDGSNSRRASIRAIASRLGELASR